MRLLHFTLRRRVHRLAVAAVAPLLAIGALAGPALATPATPPDGSSNFTFQTLDNSSDPTFNQLLGINDNGLISGYFGIGSATHPNKGYELKPPYTSQKDYVNENYPGSFQTQVTGLNNNGVTVGFWADTAGNNHGWYSLNGKTFSTADDPNASTSPTITDQLLGVNDNNIAVGFYVKGGHAFGYTYDINTNTYSAVTSDLHAQNLTPAAINNLGDIAGFYNVAKGPTESFLKESNGTTITLSVPGADSTMATGINNGDEVVGNYTVGSSTYGFAWTPGFGFETINDPNGVGQTVVNGVNDRGQLVGFYTDSSNNVDGMLATPVN